MKNSPRFASIAAALALCALARTAAATDGRYREYVIGERAGGMGGAAIAVARDVDAIFYNPAGLASSQGDSISLSANLYGIEHYKSVYDTDLGRGNDSSSFVSIPGAMGGILRLNGEWTGGVGVFAPKQEKRHLNVANDDRTRLDTYDYNDQTLWFGPAVAWAPRSSRFSLGAGIFGVYRDCNISQGLWMADGTAMTGAFDIASLGLLGQAGAQLDLGQGWRAGASVQTPSVGVWDDGTLSIGTTGEEDLPAIGVHSKKVEVDNYTPWQLGLGIGRTVENKWGFALDATYHPSASFDLMRWNVSGFRVGERMRLRHVLDFSLGGECVVAERFPVRAGVYTALSSVRLPGTEDASFSASDVDMYGVTFSVGRRKESMSVNLGLDYAFGHGHDLSYASDGELSRNPCDRNVLLVSVSTTYYF